ncbi:hypothetical protein LPN04_18975 [Rugamonas sp. A1-17]|nr:hypothetical protein [Rugamonas sp. A1-17]
MNDKNTSQNTHAITTTYQTRIVQLEQKKSKLLAQVEPLTTRRSELEREIVARDWILTDNRPKGCSETFSAATEMRKRLQAERNVVAAQVSELQNALNPLNRELAELKCELTYHQNSAITPEAVQVEIDEIRAEIDALKLDRKSLASALSMSEQHLKEIDDAEKSHIHAIDLLTNFRSKAFLAKPSDSPKLDREVADAERNMRRCREKALNAAAAKSSVVALIESTESDLGSLDEDIKHLEARLKDEQKRLRKLNAMNEWAGLMPQVRVAIRNLLEADRTIGRALIESLTHEGLKEFDHRGRMVRPAWLSGKADMMNRI